MLRSKMVVVGLAAAGALFLATAPAGAISHDDIVKGAVDGATGAAEDKVDDAKADAKDAAAEKAAENTGGMMDSVDKAQKAVDSGQKTISAGSDTVDAAKGILGGD